MIVYDSRMPKTKKKVTVKLPNTVQNMRNLENDYTVGTIRTTDNYIFAEVEEGSPLAGETVNSNTYIVRN